MVLLAALALAAVVGNASAMARARVDLHNSVGDILQGNSTEPLHGWPKMLDLSHAKLRSVKKKRNWEWSDCSVEGSSVVIRDITVVPCVPRAHSL
jgi:hypothetical protein